MIEPTVAAPQTAPEIAPNSPHPVVENKELKQFKMKVDGLDEEVDENTIRRDYQKYRSAEKKFQEAANMRKQMDNLLDAFADGDVGAFQTLKKLVPEDKLAQFAYDFLNEKVSWEEMPDHEKQLIMTKKELEKYKKDATELRTEKEKGLRQQYDRQAETWLEDKLIDVVNKLEQKYGKYVLDANIVHEIARSLEAYELTRSEDDMDPDFDGISEKTWKNWEKKANAYLSSLPIDKLKSVLTKEQLRALRQDDLSTALSQAPRGARKELDAPRQEKNKKMDVDTYFDEHLKRKFGG